MARKYPPLSQRQLDVLTWIGQGCPDGIWSDGTYKTTSYGLSERGLAKVDRRRKSWSVMLSGGSNGGTRRPSVDRKEPAGIGGKPCGSSPGGVYC